MRDDAGELVGEKCDGVGDDRRLGRICLSRTDITDSVRAEGPPRVAAVTFELAGFIDIPTKRLTVHTRQTVLENLPPLIVEHYEKSMLGFARQHSQSGNEDQISEQFRLDTMLRRLQQNPQGYDFRSRIRMKPATGSKINVLWATPITRPSA